MALWNRQPKETREDKELRLKKQFFNELKDLVDNATNGNMTLRDQFSRMLSGGYDNSDTLHLIYEDFGYPETLAFPNFWNMYRRFGPAQAVCDIPVDITWLEPPEIDGGDTFNKAFEELAAKVKLWKRLKGLDSRQRVGRYSGLFIRVKDGKKPSESLDTLNGITSIESVSPLYEGQLAVATVDTKETSPDYGNPLKYSYSGNTTGNRNEKGATSFQIDKSRIIIAAEGADDGTIYGKPALESVFNDLMDLRKISGAGGEGFYQNTRNAPVINTKEGFEPPSTTAEKEQLDTELDGFLNKWRKKFVTQGLEFQYPDINLDNPKPFYEGAINNIAAGSKIPGKLIMGNQTGRLAGDSDLEHFLSLMNSRRANYGVEIIESFIDWCVEFKVLPEPVNLTIEWSDLLVLSDSEKLELSKKMSETNRNQFSAGGEHVFSPEQIAEMGGFEFEQIELPSEELDDSTDEDEVGKGDEDEGSNN